MVQDEGHLIIQQYMYSNFQLDKIYMLKYFHGDPAQNLVHVTCMLHENFMDLHALLNIHVAILMYMHVSCNMHGFRTFFMHVT